MERTPAEIINQRRRQIIIHSVLYYRMNESLIPDITFDRWCRELVRLQEDYPEVASTAPFAKEFEGFDGSTGFHLSDNTWGISEAEQLLRYMKENGLYENRDNDGYRNIRS